MAAGPASAQQREVTFVSPQAALEQGVSAYRGGFYEIALPALSYAAERNMLLAQFHLALIYADNASPGTDHVKAYHLFRKIVERNAQTIDVDDDELAPYVGRALTALARYVLRGLPEDNLQPNASRAAHYFQEAATFFRDRDAQFELAKLFLKGEGVQENPRQAISWLSTLAQNGHAGAQAFFADLLWRGKGVPKDERKALALITIAVERAPVHERIWIEDIYRVIYCGTASGVRKQADGLIASFRKAYTARGAGDGNDRMALGLGPTQACSDGEPLPAIPRGAAAPVERTGDPAGLPPAAPDTSPRGPLVDIHGRDAPGRR